MNLGFLDGGTAAHEFGHARRPGARALEPARRHPVERAGRHRRARRAAELLGRGEGAPQRLLKYALDQIKGTQFDPDSIMLYSFPATGRSTGSRPTRTTCCRRSTRRSSRARRCIPSRRRSSATPAAHGRRTEGRRLDRGSGEEDLYAFDVASDGLYEVTTRGSTDVFLKLFGPDSDTHLVEHAHEEERLRATRLKSATGVDL